MANTTSAYDMFARFLESIGINIGPALKGIIEKAVIDGITPDQIDLIMPEIQQTPAWKRRFPGWEQRVSNGYNQLTVREYLDLEDEYHSILAENGLPAGFYDDPSDFGNWIANNVAPDEIRSRVSMAKNAVMQVDPTARDLLSKFYGVTAGDLTAYFLDRDRALPVMDRQWKAANVAAFAARNGLQIYGSEHYENLIDQGVTVDAAAAGYSTVRAFNDAFGRIASTYGETYDQTDAEQDVFFNNNEKRRRLLAKEISTFSGTSRGATGTADRGTGY